MVTPTLVGNIKIKLDGKAYSAAFSAYVEKLEAGIGKLKKERVYKSTIEFRNVHSLTKKRPLCLRLWKL